MRTTVNIEDEALELGKRKAEELGTTLGQVVSEAILAAYRERPAERRPARYDLPVSGAGGVQPGVDLSNNAALEELMAAPR